MLQVPEPVKFKPTDDEFYTKDDLGTLKPNPMFLKEHFFKEGRLTEAQALRILEEATELLKTEPNMVTVTSPVTSMFASFLRQPIIILPDRSLW